MPARAPESRAVEKAVGDWEDILGFEVLSGVCDTRRSLYSRGRGRSQHKEGGSMVVVIMDL